LTAQALKPHAPFALGLLPLLAGWALTALLFRNDWAAPAIVAIGTVATVAAVLLGLPVWAWNYHEAAAATAPHGAEWPERAMARWLLHTAVALAFTALWVWLQYALNPYRMRPVGEAMLMSRSLVWQAMAGLWLYGSVTMLARAAGTRVPGDATKRPDQPALLDRLTIRLGDRTMIVATSGIERLQAADDYVAVFADGRRLLASHRLYELAARLDRTRFLRVHRSHIVNLSFIDGFERAAGDRVRVQMRSGVLVLASRAGSALLRARLQ
jgi:DNA-binding LytR/AlgR family response regulator